MRRSHMRQVFPQNGVDAWSKASALAAIAAFVAAGAFPLAAIATFCFRRAWPGRAFAFGILSGVAVGAVIDLWCFHLMPSSCPSKPHNPPMKWTEPAGK